MQSQASVATEGPSQDSIEIEELMPVRQLTDEEISAVSGVARVDQTVG